MKDSSRGSTRRRNEGPSGQRAAAAGTARDTAESTRQLGDGERLRSLIFQRLLEVGGIAEGRGLQWMLDESSIVEVHRLVAELVRCIGAGTVKPNLLASARNDRKLQAFLSSVTGS